MVGTWPAAGSVQVVCYVDDDASLGGDGKAWVTAYRDLQDALAAARVSAGSVREIWVAAGTYRPDLGAAVSSGSSTTTLLSDCRFAQHPNGVVSQDAGSLTMTRCRFEDNSGSG